MSPFARKCDNVYLNGRCRLPTDIDVSSTAHCHSSELPVKLTM